MKLEKAIEIGTDMSQNLPTMLDQDRKDAVKLLIEAGKSVLHSREIFPDVSVDYLPGETTEEETERR